MTDGTRSRFVQPLERVLTLANGDTLTVRRRLTAGEQLDMFARLYLGGANGNGNGGGRIRLNPIQTGFALVVAYLLDWSLTDAHGARVVIRGEPLDVIEAAIRMLDPDDFEEIKRAVETHDTEITAERTAQKKIPNGAAASKVTSESLFAAGGVSSGSET